jgi:thiosulfate reductase cytochrome b subunit
MVIRIWHLLNAIFILVLIVTGLSMHYSGTENPLISFARAVKIHNICGTCMTASYFIFFIGNIVSGNREHYKIKFSGLGPAIVQQLKFYLIGYFRKDQSPFPATEVRKFNPLQALTYALVMYAGVPLLALTGWFLFFPDIIPGKVFGVSGILMVDILHITTGFLLSVFLFAHIYLCTIDARPGNNFRAILTGWKAIEKR